jgi:hypothetical protein
MKTSAMITMLEKNPNLRFSVITLIGQDTVGMASGHLAYEKSGNDVHINPVFLAFDWSLVREPVPVWEAIKAYLQDDKTVYCENGGVCGPCYKDPITNNGFGCLKGLRHGEWYIEEPLNES